MKQVVLVTQIYLERTTIEVQRAQLSHCEPAYSQRLMRLKQNYAEGSRERADIDLAHDMGEDPISEFCHGEILVLIHVRIGGIMIKNKMLAIIVITVAGVLGGGILTLVIGLPSSPCAGTTPIIRSFTIIENLNGYNDSASHPGSWLTNPWPVMNVRQCEMVVIKITNADTQTHGFAVDFYATRGTEVQGGQSLTVQFLASKVGQFRVYCNVLCSVHYSMLYGSLNVT